MKQILLRSVNRIGCVYTYLGLLYAVYFIYFIVHPAYSKGENVRYSSFNLMFFYFFLQGYWYLILTRFVRPKFSGNGEKFCEKCKRSFDQRSFHCSICRICVPIRDHHCFFVGVCIGQHNQHYFILMLFHLLCAHFVGYAFVSSYLWDQVGGFSFSSFLRILFFQFLYPIGFIESKWQAWICFHHYLAYFDILFIGDLFRRIVRRSINGQTQYEEKKCIGREKQNFYQIFRCSTKLRLIFPLIPSATEF